MESEEIVGKVTNLHYKHGECEAVDFIECVLVNLHDCDNEELWHIGNALKYAMRAGYKGDWLEDAKKCADYINRFKTGGW